jgi:type II secretory ATPase GspE/PulE/Tfp pilus assembly ATPase PilB-like protein
VLLVTDALRDAVVADASITDLRRLANTEGMIMLRHDGFRKVREGITTIEEVIQISGDIIGAADRIAAVE